MRMPSFAVVLVPLLLLACDREPVAPDVAPPLLSAAHGEFVAEGYENFTDYVSCANGGLGESIHWSYSFRITISTVTSASGNELWKWKEVEHPYGYLAEGVASGDVWTILPDESRIVGLRHFQDNGNLVAIGVWQERLENQDGDEMFLQTTLHFTRADGVWRVARVAINACSLH